MDRSCCYPFEGSSARPSGEDFQVVTTDVYTKYFTRCQGDMCNLGKGDNSDDADNGGKYSLIFVTTIIYSLLLYRYYSFI